MTRIPALALPDFEHLGAANRAYSLSRRSAVLHFDGRRILHFLLAAALHTIRLHLVSPFLPCEASYHKVALVSRVSSYKFMPKQEYIAEKDLTLCRVADYAKTQD